MSLKSVTGNTCVWCVAANTLEEKIKGIKSIVSKACIWCAVAAISVLTCARPDTSRWVSASEHVRVDPNMQLDFPADFAGICRRVDTQPWSTDSEGNR